MTEAMIEMESLPFQRAVQEPLTNATA